MEEFQNLFLPFAERVKAGTGCGSEECLYHGFAIHENTVFCREGYKNAQGALNHLNEAKDLLAKAKEIVGKDGMEISVIAPRKYDKLNGTRVYSFQGKNSLNYLLSASMYICNMEHG